MSAPRIERHKGGPTACELQVWRQGPDYPKRTSGWADCGREARFVVVRPSLSMSGRRTERRQAACSPCAMRYSASAAVPMPGERTLFDEGARA